MSKAVSLVNCNVRVRSLYTHDRYFFGYVVRALGDKFVLFQDHDEELKPRFVRVSRVQPLTGRVHSQGSVA